MNFLDDLPHLPILPIEYEIKVSKALTEFIDNDV